MHPTTPRDATAFRTDSSTTVLRPVFPQSAPASNMELQFGENEMRSDAYQPAHLFAYPVEYIAGIDLYNAGEFHAAHDAWEERWLGAVGPAEKLFLQAMIQSAVAFHHLQIGRPGAARQMYTRAKEKFDRLGKDVF